VARIRKHYFIPKIKACGSTEALIPLYETSRRRVAKERNFVTPCLKKDSIINFVLAGCKVLLSVIIIDVTYGS